MRMWIPPLITKQNLSRKHWRMVVYVMDWGIICCKFIWVSIRIGFPIGYMFQRCWKLVYRCRVHAKFINICKFMVGFNSIAISLINSIISFKAFPLKCLVSLCTSGLHTLSLWNNEHGRLLCFSGMLGLSCRSHFFLWFFNYFSFLAITVMVLGPHDFITYY